MTHLLPGVVTLKTSAMDPGRSRVRWTSTPVMVLFPLKSLTCTADLRRQDAVH